jgi:glutaminase
MAMDYQNLLKEVFVEVQGMNLQGEVASYIPELGRVDPNKFGIALVSNNGDVFTVGDAEEPFSIQSISKAFTLAMSYSYLQQDLWERVGVEPSGSAFNSLVQLESENGIPRNPFINAGALVITDIIMQHEAKPLDSILDSVRLLSGENTIGFNKKTALSEIKHSSRNKAVSHFMKSFNNIHSRIDKLIEVYCQHCAIEMSCIQLAKAFQLFSGHGAKVSFPGEKLSVSQIKRMNAIMQTCGFYDEAGEFAFKVGLPGKSGVGGGIAAILPGEFSIAVWSPPLNKKGNSLKGMKALEILTTKLGYSVF